MIVATALVLMMSVPGLALFYAGMVRKKNVLATMAQTFAATALVSVLWMAIAYSLTLAGGGAVIGTLSRVMLHGIGMDTVSPLAPTIPEALFMMYQMTFAVITVALVAGHLSASMGALTWMALEWWTRGKPSVLGMISGAVAGLGTITPASGFVLPWRGLIIGLIAGVVCFYSRTWLKIVCGYDDSLDVFGVHGVGGAVGTLLVGFFAARSVGNVSGLFEGHATQVLIQLYGIVVTFAWSAFATFVLFKAISAFTALRVDRQSEMEGFDVTQHGEALQ